MDKKQATIDSLQTVASDFLTQSGRAVEGAKENLQRWIQDVEPMAERLLDRAATGDEGALDSLGFLEDDLAGTVRTAFQDFTDGERLAMTSIAKAVLRTAVAVAVAA